MPARELFGRRSRSAASSRLAADPPPSPPVPGGASPSNDPLLQAHLRQLRQRGLELQPKPRRGRPPRPPPAPPPSPPLQGGASPSNDPLLQDQLRHLRQRGLELQRKPRRGGLRRPAPARHDQGLDPRRRPDRGLAGERVEPALDDRQGAVIG